MSTNRKVSLTNDGVLELYEAEVNGTNCITMKAPSSFVGNYTMTLPTALGAETDLLTMSSAGQVAVLPIGTPGYYLKVNSSGNGYDWGVIAASLQAAYNGGQSITTGSGQITLTNTAANEAMVINQSANDEAIRIEHTNTGSPNALQITNAGTGRGIDVVANGNCAGIRVTKSNVGNASCLVVANSGTGNGLNIQQYGAAQGIYVSQAGASHAADFQKSSTNASAALRVVNSGTGAAVQIDQTGVGHALTITNANVNNGINIAQNANGIALAVAKSNTGSASMSTFINEGSGEAIVVTQRTTAGKAVRIYQQTNDEALRIEKSGTGTGAAVMVYNTGTSPSINISTGGSGKDVEGTSNTWSVDKAGNALFASMVSTLSVMKQQIFTFDWAASSAAQSTGALGFTPNFTIALMKATNHTSVGFSTGTGSNAKMICWRETYNVGTTAYGNAYDNGLAGGATLDTDQANPTDFTIAVSAFGPSNITLTPSQAITARLYILVVGV